MPGRAEEPSRSQTPSRISAGRPAVCGGGRTALSPARASSSSTPLRPGSIGPRRSARGRSSIPPSSSRGRRAIGADGRIYPHVHIMTSTAGRAGQGPEFHGHGGHRPRERRAGRAVLPVPAEDPGLRRGQGRQFRRDEEHRLRPALQGPASELPRRQHRSRRTSTSAPGRSPATTTASPRTRPTSAPGPSSAPGRSSSPRSGSGGALMSPRARPSPRTWPPAPWPSLGPARWRSPAGSWNGSGRGRKRKGGDGHETQRHPHVLQERPGRRLAGDLRHRQDEKGPASTPSPSSRTTGRRPASSTSRSSAPRSSSGSRATGG